MSKQTIKIIIAVVIYIFLMYFLPGLIPEYQELIDKGILPSTITPETFSIIMNMTIYVTLFIVVSILIKNELVEDFVSLKTYDKKDIFANSVVGYFLLAVGSGIGSSITIALGGTGNSENQQAIAKILTSEYGFVMIICIALIGPIVEEFIFRKSLFALCDKLKINRIITILITSALFGLIHVTSGGDYVEVFPYIFMGIAMGIAYNMSKNIIVPIIVHIFQNTLSVVSILYLLPLLEQLQQNMPQ